MSLSDVTSLHRVKAFERLQDFQEITINRWQKPLESTTAEKNSIGDFKQQC